MQAGDRGGDLVSPGPSFGEPQPQAASAAHEPPSSDAEKPQAQAFRFPAAGLAAERDHLGPGEQLAGQGDDLAPELILGVALEREVPQPGDVRDPGAVADLPAAVVGGSPPCR